MESKRRLPILQAADDPDENPARPRWQWVFLGALALFTVWLPLAGAAAAIASKFAPRGGETAAGAAGAGVAVAFAAASALALAIAALGAGFLIGKWGAPRAGVREAALAGLAASLVALLASSISLGFVPATLLVIPIAASASTLGGWLGRRRR